MLVIARASYYCEHTNESEENLRVMQVIDMIYLEHPEFGSRLMTEMLYRNGYTVNRKRVPPTAYAIFNLKKSSFLEVGQLRFIRINNGLL